MIVEIDFPLPAGGRIAGCFAAPRECLIADRLEDVPAVVAAAEQAWRAGCWVVGLVCYEAAPAFDAALAVPAGRTRLPLACFAVYDGIAAPLPAGSGEFASGLWRDDLPADEFVEDIAAIHAGIRAGCYYQVNHTTRLRTAFDGDAHAYYRALKAAQPAGYCAYLDAGDWQVLSVSPELFFRWDADGVLAAQPMKGTAPRAAAAADDAAEALRLRASEKERAENLMIVDLLRNDLGRVAATGSVRVPRLFEVAALPTAWQMTSTVECTTRPGAKLVDIFHALFPCGSVTGAPKVAAMAEIAGREPSPRGVYCGTVGVLVPDGPALFNVAIRTVHIDAARDARQGMAQCGVGSGITADSTAAAEATEWQVKRRFLWRAGAPFRLLETLRLEDGQYWLLDGHLDRLAASALHFGFPFVRTQAEQTLRQAVADMARGAWRVRLLAGRDGSLAVEGAELDSLPSDPWVVLATSPVSSADEFLRHKTTQRDVYAARANVDAFDTLLWNERDELTEFTRGNLVMDIDGRRLTPPLAAGLLPGVWRAKMLAEGAVVEQTITRADLERAERLWFVNSVRGMLQVTLRHGT